MKATDGHDGELVEVPRRTRRMRRHASPAEALEIRARICLEFCERDGLSVAIVADIMNLSESAIRRDLRIARSLGPET